VVPRVCIADKERRSVLAPRHFQTTAHRGLAVSPGSCRTIVGRTRNRRNGGTTCMRCNFVLPIFLRKGAQAAQNLYTFPLD